MLDLETTELMDDQFGQFDENNNPITRLGERGNIKSEERNEEERDVIEEEQEGNDVLPLPQSRLRRGRRQRVGVATLFELK